jgi:hypothetical protein
MSLVLTCHHERGERGALQFVVGKFTPWHAQSMPQAAPEFHPVSKSIATV